jgi:hypothetical protein
MATCPAVAGVDTRFSATFAGIFVAYKLKHDLRPEHRGRAGLKDSPEPVADPSTGLWWGFDQQAPSGGIDFAYTKCLEPDAVGRLVDNRCKLVLHA